MRLPSTQRSSQSILSLAWAARGQRDAWWPRSEHFRWKISAYTKYTIRSKLYQNALSAIYKHIDGRFLPTLNIRSGRPGPGFSSSSLSLF
ncbi:hypothetical protein BRADI_4g04105v3 [Brachypodium distachyon]|uniref:Uncharacterized protein n=1 Tax=Brachypodium distachyon TaxID=15368 RepID=A0A2K2CKD3_BRADI|nr:hypothetical protein BRADI_4g04105v3 [Brachypodium distachyon]